MKRYIYQYTCLAYSFVQLFIFIAMLYTLIGMIPYDQELGNYTNTITFSIFTFCLVFILAIIDKFLRGLQNESFWSDCLLLTLVSPFRFICQIITTVRVHIADSYGNDSFGERGCDSSYFPEYIYYYFFNAENESPRY